VAVLSTPRKVFARSNIVVMNLNPTQETDVRLLYRLCLCYPLYVRALRWAHLPSKESPQLFVSFIIFKFILKWE
jgi:hypothetical protein